MAIGIDESLDPTATDCANKLKHFRNMRETVRKTGLFIVTCGVSVQGGVDVDLWLEPCGSNWKYQTTRFAMYDSNARFLGFAALQRHHGPDEPIRFYDTIGRIGEYEARATEYSCTVLKADGVTSAVDEVQQTRHIDALKDHLQHEYVERSRELPDDIMCRRIYRRIKLPAISTGYMTEVIKWAKAELDETSSYVAGPPVVTAGWDGLRQALFEWLKRQHMNVKTAHYIADWKVYSGLTQTQIGKQYGVERDTVNDAIRRYAEIFEGHELELGRMAERWVAAHTDSLGSVVGTGSKDSVDVLLTMPEPNVAINVKWALEEPARRDFSSTPEDRHMPNAVLCVVWSRIPQIRLFPITGTSTYAHPDKGVPCAPEGLEEAMREVLAHV